MTWPNLTMNYVSFYAAPLCQIFKFFLNFLKPLTHLLLFGIFLCFNPIFSQPNLLNRLTTCTKNYIECIYFHYVHDTCTLKHPCTKEHLNTQILFLQIFIIWNCSQKKFPNQRLPTMCKMISTL